MKMRKTLIASAIVLTSVAALTYVNRITILQHSLGWYTDWNYPREPNKPVPWMTGPSTADKPVSERPPNIVLILADDLGFNEVSTNGGGYTAQGAPTPNIDSIAREGVQFSQGYAGAAVCTVSRAALLTGRYPWRFGLEFTPIPGAMGRVVGKLYADTDPLLSLIHISEPTRPY